MISNTKKLILAAVFAALIFIATAFLPKMQIPGGYIHFGDVLIYISASILPLPYSVMSAAVGASLADSLSGYIVWVPATLVVKSIIALLFSNKKKTILTKRNIIAAIISVFAGISGYYLYEALIISSFAAALESIPFNILQGIGSLVIYIALAFTLDRAKTKELFDKI